MGDMDQEQCKKWVVQESEGLRDELGLKGEFCWGPDKYEPEFKFKPTMSGPQRTLQFGWTDLDSCLVAFQNKTRRRLRAWLENFVPLESVTVEILKQIVLEHFYVTSDAVVVSQITDTDRSWVIQFLRKPEPPLEVSLPSLSGLDRHEIGDILLRKLNSYALVPRVSSDSEL